MLGDIYQNIGPALLKRSFAEHEQKLLETDRNIRDPHFDKRRARELRADFLSSTKQEMRWGEGRRNLPAKLLAARVTGRSETPVVCSWDLCDVLSLEEAGKRFSKCANCSLAFYCR